SRTSISSSPGTRTCARRRRAEADSSDALGGEPLTPESSEPNRAPLRRVVALVVQPLQAFLRLEASSGLLLLGTAAVAFVWANASRETYAAATAAEIA